MPKGLKGFKKGFTLFKNETHPNWKGGKPKCFHCGVLLSSYYAKRCKKCCKIFLPNPLPILKKGQQSNSGRTHFKKGQIPWNKNLKGYMTKKMEEAFKKKRGVPMPKPRGFSETMRKVNPPKGRKIKYDARDKEKKVRVWRYGYIFIYKPNHPTSRKKPPDYGYIAEHRYIIELKIGRSLNKKEVVHHIDGNKGNNDIENLLVCKNQKEHNHIHTKMEFFIESLIRKGGVYYDRERENFFFR